MSLLADRETCRKMGEAGRQRVQRFYDLRVIVDEYRRLYDGWLEREVN